MARSAWLKDIDKAVPQTRIAEQMHRPIRVLCVKLAMDSPTLVNQAVREFLERHRLWPAETVEGEVRTLLGLVEQAKEETAKILK